MHSVNPFQYTFDTCIVGYYMGIEWLIIEKPDKLTPSCTITPASHSSQLLSPILVSNRAPRRLHNPTPSCTITPTSAGSHILSPRLVIILRTPRRPCNPALSCTITPTSHVPRIQTCMGVRDFGCPAPGNCATVTDNYPIPSRLPDPIPDGNRGFWTPPMGWVIG